MRRLALGSVVLLVIGFGLLWAATTIDCSNLQCSGDYVYRDVLKTLAAGLGLAHLVIGFVLLALAIRQR